jgi:hypothetical protein
MNNVIPFIILKEVLDYNEKVEGTELYLQILQLIYRQYLLDELEDAVSDHTNPRNYLS